jgi:hypothetical protein
MTIKFDRKKPKEDEIVKKKKTIQKMIPNKKIAIKKGEQI